jgi:type IV pilus assembly protein PilM
MSASLLSKYSSKANEIVVIVLGTCTTKALHVRRQGDGLHLLNYVLKPTPVLKEGLAGKALAHHLREVSGELEAGTNRAVVVIGMGQSLVRTLEVPALKPPELRQLVKQNSKHFFQEELTDYEFDCFVLPEPGPSAAAGTPSPQRKNRALVVGAKTALLDDLQAGVKAAGLSLVQVAVSQVGLVNAALAGLPELPADEVVAIVDLGFRTSSITFLVGRAPGLSRTVGIGGDTLTASLASAMNIPYEVAEGLKVFMPDKVRDKLQERIGALAQELRTAIDFFESQEEKEVRRIFVAGGTARSEYIVQGLQDQLRIPCEKLALARFGTSQLPLEKADTLAKDAPQLAIAAGAAAAALTAGLIPLNLLAQREHEQRMSRRDPAKWFLRAAALVVLFLAAWAGQLGLQRWRLHADLSLGEMDLSRAQKAAAEVGAGWKRLGELSQTERSLEELSTNRFLWVLPLDALQFCMVDDIQVIGLQLQQATVQAPGKPGSPSPGSSAKATSILEQITLRIRAKNSGPPAAMNKFIETIAAQPYFAGRLRKQNPVELKERQPTTVDPTDPTKTLVLFTIDCHFAERSLSSGQVGRP